MHWVEHGSGPAVLLLHGAPSSTAYFAGLVEALAPTHRVLMPELPGYGRSAPLEAPYSLEAAQRALEEDLLARDVRELAVVGFSLGAYRAIALALTARVRVTRIVTMGGIAGLDDATRSGMREFARLLRARTDLHPLMLGRMTAPGFGEAHPALAVEIVSWLDVVPSEVLAEELEAIAGSEDLAPRLGEIDAPMLVLVGSLDVAAPLPFSQAIVGNARHAELWIVDGSGHALLYEAPERVVPLIAGFLEAAQRDGAIGALAR